MTEKRYWKLEGGDKNLENSFEEMKVEWKVMIIRMSNGEQQILVWKPK